MPDFDSFDGLRLSYLDDGDGRTVVLLHGFAADTNVNYVRSGILDLLLRAATPVAEIFIEADELDRVPADPDPETESSAAQHVKRGGLLCDEYRLALGEDQHLGRELDIPGTGGEKAE